MLSENTIRVIKSTVPVLEVHGEAITSHFYKTMFAHHPELLNIFNHANQNRDGSRPLLPTWYTLPPCILIISPQSCQPCTKSRTNTAALASPRNNTKSWARIC